METLVYRSAKESDLMSVAILVSKILGSCYIDSSDKSIKTFDEIVESNKKEIAAYIKNCIVCVDHNKIVGVGGVSDIMSSDPYGLNLDKYKEYLYFVVDTPYQRKGIGSTIMKKTTEKNDVPILYEAWGDNGQYVNSKFILEKAGFKMVKDLGNTYYPDNGYCPYCVNRDKNNCHSCLAQIWIKMN